MKWIRYLHKDTLQRELERHTTYKTTERKMNFMKTNIFNSKRFLSLFLTMVIIFGMLSLNVFALEVNNGYTTDENGVMAYQYIYNGFDILGYFNGEWKQTTYSNGGYSTFLKQSESTKTVNAVSSEDSGYTVDNLNVAIDFSFTNDGKTMQILYTVKNNGSQTETFSLGSGADIQIGYDDNAEITPFEDGSGFKMVSDYLQDYDSSSNEYAQFNFFASGYIGVTDVSDYWYGSYSSNKSTTGAYWAENKSTAVFYGNNVSETGTFDSAASWHWADQVLSAGETATYSVLIGIGGAGSENAAQGNGISSATGETTLELSYPAENGISDFTVKVDGVALTQGVDYTITDADTKSPVIKFNPSAGLTSTSVITVEIAGISEPVEIENNVPLHTHSYNYAVNTENASQIIESCSCGHSEAATIEIDTTVSTVYTGSAITPLKVTYSDGWVGDKTSEISYSNNIYAGTDTASGTMTIEGKTATKSFSIMKKAADAPDAPTAQNSISYGAKLSAVGLTSGWIWVNADLVPTVQNAGYTAYYTPTDTDNFDWTSVEGWNATADRVERTVAVTVLQSNPVYTTPVGMTATYGDTLTDINISAWGSGWRWKESTTSVGDIGTKTFVAIFTPSDTDNYKAVEVNVTVTVNAADPAYTPPVAKQELVYNGIEKDLVSKGSATGGTMQYALGTQTEPTGSFSASVPVGRGADTYYVWYRVVSDSNHNDVAPACVAVTIAKAPLTITANNKTIIYGDAPTNAGVTYTGFVANETEAVLNGTLAYDLTYTQFEAAGSYDITPKGLASDNYEIIFQKGMLTVEQKEIDITWGATMFLPYTGNSLVPNANATNLVNGDECILTTAVVETADGAGIIPGTWTAKVTSLSNSNYKLPASGVRVTATFEIVNASQNYAPNVSAVNETIRGKADGKITGVDSTMEYRKDGESAYTSISGTEVSGLADGIYYVRYAAKPYYNASPEKQVTIAEGRKLTVTVTQNQIGYTLTADKAAIDWREEVVLTYTLKEGYTETSAFAIKVNGNPVSLSGGKYTITDPETDVEITVEGVLDETAPIAKIDVKDNKWTSFWNNLTFGLFFNETQDVTITANDAGSGMKSVEYYLVSSELELDEVRAITDWQSYDDTFKIDPNNRYVVYAKVTDNAGNTLYINSDGITLDNVAPTLEGIENGQTYYGDLTVIISNEQFYDIKSVTLDGETMGFLEGTCGPIPADNAEHIVVVEDHAGNKTTYTVTVMQNYTVTYKANGVTVDTQTVGHGKDAVAPTIPAKDGYTQTAPTWDKDGTNITGNTEINAVYTINKYTVTYKADGKVVDTVTVEHSKDAVAPTVPAKDGYTQTAPSWDKDGKNITADTEINAVYTINEYTITFMDENGVYKILTYKHGETVTMPDVPTKEGFTVKWETTIDKATGDATIKAVYTEIPNADTPTSPQTGDNSNMFLWIALLFISGGALITLTICDRKQRTINK